MGSVNTNDLIAFVVVAFALTGSPGPATLSLAATGAAYGFKAGRNYLVGLIVGVMIVVTGTAAGMFAVITAIPGAAGALTLFASAYIGYLAFRIATTPPIGEPAATSTCPGFLAGVILNLSNPKAYAAFAALFSGFMLVPTAPELSAVVQVGICFLVLCVINPTWLLIGSVLRRTLRDQQTSRWVNRGFAVLLVASVALTVFL